MGRTCIFHHLPIFTIEINHPMDRSICQIRAEQYPVGCWGAVWWLGTHLHLDPGSKAMGRLGLGDYPPLPSELNSKNSEKLASQVVFQPTFFRRTVKLPRGVYIVSFLTQRSRLSLLNFLGDDEYLVGKIKFNFLFYFLKWLSKLCFYRFVPNPTGQIFFPS